MCVSRREVSDGGIAQEVRPPLADDVFRPSGADESDVSPGWRTLCNAPSKARRLPRSCRPRATGSRFPKASFERWHLSRARWRKATASRSSRCATNSPPMRRRPCCTSRGPTSSACSTRGAFPSARSVHIVACASTTCRRSARAKRRVATRCSRASPGVARPRAGVLSGPGGAARRLRALPGGPA